MSSFSRHVQAEVERQDQVREAAEYRVALQDALKEAEAEARRVELERELEERARREEEERLARKQVRARYFYAQYALAHCTVIRYSYMGYTVQYTYIYIYRIINLVFRVFRIYFCTHHSLRSLR